MRLLLAQSPRIRRGGLRKVLGWLPLPRCGQTMQMKLVHRCRTGNVPGYLQEQLKSNGRVRHLGNRGFICLATVNANFLKKSITFSAAQDWNSLPKEMRHSHHIYFINIPPPPTVWCCLQCIIQSVICSCMVFLTCVYSTALPGRLA